MISDLDESDLEKLPEYDVCIVGSGPAGAVLARELRHWGLRIAVLESGKDHPTPLGSRLRTVVSEGLVIREDSRERVLGGASTTWTGLSALLDPIDLEPRHWAGTTGWPIKHEDLLAWYEGAAARYRFPPPRDFELGASPQLRKLRAAGMLRPVWERLEEKIFLAADPPQNFGAEWKVTYAGPTVDLWLDATVLELAGESNPRRVAYGRVRSSGGRVRLLRARVFVLATGAIENARILLLSRSLWPEGLGNDTDQVGRYLMNHPKGYKGVVRFQPPVADLPYFFGCLQRGVSGYAGLRLRESEQRRLGVLNSYVRLEPLIGWTGNAGAQWLVRFGFSRLFRGRARIRAARVRNFMEMEPDPENRVLLSEVHDEYGQPVALVRHRPTARDRRSLIELHTALAEEFSRTGIGRLDDRVDDGDPWPIDMDASHHMGTTRMGTDPATSVVNPDLRLHEVENVYLAGSSVFPTGGCANPTYTIVALSIRLADHLEREVLRRGPGSAA